MWRSEKPTYRDVLKVDGQDYCRFPEDVLKPHEKAEEWFSWNIAKADWYIKNGYITPALDFLTALEVVWGGRAEIDRLRARCHRIQIIGH